MRPLETQLTMSTHVWLFNRVKETLRHEGLLSANAGDAEVRDALIRWIAMIEQARKTDHPVH